MPRCDVRTRNPEHYARVKAEQAQLEQQYFSQGLMIARICPYCGNKVEMLVRGHHDASQLKCLNCFEEVKFPPIQFRKVHGYYHTA